MVTQPPNTAFTPSTSGSLRISFLLAPAPVGRLSGRAACLAAAPPFAYYNSADFMYAIHARFSSSEMERRCAQVGEKGHLHVSRRRIWCRPLFSTLSPSLAAARRGGSHDHKSATRFVRRISSGGFYFSACPRNSLQTRFGRRRDNPNES